MSGARRQAVGGSPAAPRRAPGPQGPKAPKQAILFDLFGTVVHFAARVPTVEIAGEKWRTTMGWLADAVHDIAPQIDFTAFTKALMGVTAEMTRQRAPEYLELPSRQRFQRALERLEQPIADIEAVAQQLSLVHMEHLASQTVLPPGHRETLETLAAGHRLALISNFDHGATARRILRDHGVDHFFDPIVISEEFGRRKPHRSIFDSTLASMGLDAGNALFVGDSIDDDVRGAAAAEIAMVWINSNGEALPPDVAAPIAVIRSLPEIVEVLHSEA